MHTNHHLTSLVLLLSALSPFVSAQDTIHYKFDAGYGTKVINYAAGSPVPAEGTITSTKPNAPAASWIPGVFNTGFAGAVQSPNQNNLVTSGWNPGTISSSISYACWVKTSPSTPNPSLSYLFGATPFRAYTGAGAILTTGWNAGNQYVTSRVNVFTQAKLGWLHIALVLDNSTMQATYYHNGVAETPIAMTGPVSITSSGFWVGADSPTHATNYPSVYDLDEFVFATRAITAAEIAVLAASPRAGDAGYGGGCGGLTLASAGGAPQVGNLAYQLTLTSTWAGSFTIGFGSNRSSVGGLPLPFDLGTVLPGLGTCLVDSSFDLLMLSGGKGPGTANVGLPIPMNPTLAGLTLYLQAPAFGGPGPLSLSNAFSLGIGY